MNDTRSERRHTVGASDGDRLENVTREEALNWVDEHLDLMETLGGENGRDYWVRLESKPENTD
jgi:hypothetical protein